MAERFFFALWPGAAQRLGLVRVRRDLPDHGGRDTHPEDLHLTLFFLGELDVERRACAEAAADGVQGMAFSLTLDRVGAFPRARILWCGASESPPPLLDLVEALNDGLRGCGLRPERRPYVAHATLARKARPLPARSLDDPIRWPVKEFVLAAGREGAPPRYRVLRRWPLAP